MNPKTLLTPLAAALLGLTTLPALGQSQEAAQVIFTNSTLTVIDSKGTERIVKQGDLILPGERVITPPGVIGQIRLPDGTLLGARPGADLKLDTFAKVSGTNILILNEGNVRVINTQPPRGQKPMPIDVISPISTLHLTTGDGEAIHVKPGNKPNIEPGTYNRLQIGTAVVRNDKSELPLPPMQPVLATKIGVPLLPIAVLPTILTKLEPVLAPPPSLAPISPALATTLVGDLRSISPVASASTFTPTNIAALNPVPSTPLDAPAKTLLGSATPAGTTGTVILSQTLTPQYQAINPATLNTAKLLPPAPPPPPPPKTITCTKCLILR